MKRIPNLSGFLFLVALALLTFQRVRAERDALVVSDNKLSSPIFLKAQVDEDRQDPSLVTGQVVTAPRDDELSRQLREYDLIRIDQVAAAARIRNGGRLVLRTSRGEFDLDLSPYDLRSADYVGTVGRGDGSVQKIPRSPSGTYKGSVKGMDRAQARIALKDNSFEGAIITETERYFIQPARNLSQTVGSDYLVFYKGSDATAETGTCGVTLAEKVANQKVVDNKDDPRFSLVASDQITRIAPLKIVRIATDADGEYVAAAGGAAQANAQILNIMNLVDGIYQVETGLGFQVVFQNAWADPTLDPYSSTDPSILLAQFKTHWEGNFSSVQRSIAHLWTGRDLNGNTLGLAYTGTACVDVSFSYGLSQKFPFAGSSTTSQTVVLTAHEIGHNFGAAHPNSPDSETPFDVAQACQNTIMQAAIADGANFCRYSRSQIIGHATAFSSCLTDTSMPPISPTPCAETPITTSGAAGVLSASDCAAPDRGVRFFADLYSFDGVAGQQVRMTMNKTSGTLDPYLYLVGPDGSVVMQDDDSNLNKNARLPPGDFVTLPFSGKYIIEATSFGELQEGGYTLTFAFNPGCVLTANASQQNFPAGGGTGFVTTGGCGGQFTTDTNPADGSWLVNQVTGGSGNLNFTVAPNSNVAGRRGFLILGGSQKFGGIRIPITQSGSGPDCASVPIAFGQTINSSLSTTDCQSPVRGNGYYADRYSFTAPVGQRLQISLSSSTFDTYLTLIGPNGVVMLIDDDSGGLTNSRIPGGSGMLTIGVQGTYALEVSGFGASATGAYSLTLSGEGPQSTIQFGASGFSGQEGANNSEVSVTVTRNGDTSTTAKVDYATSDRLIPSNCNVFNGASSSRCDYLVTSGTLTFAANEVSKTISIPIVDDSYAEGSETFLISLSNPAGAVLASPDPLTVTILDNESTNGPNPIDVSSMFVRQHYLDFLNREPDMSGLSFWSNQIEGCSPQPCTEIKRINVSAAFFLSIEFQQTGYLVERLYKAAYGNAAGTSNFGPTHQITVPIIRVNEFLPDTQKIARGVIVNQTGWETVLENNKQAFATEFVQRSRFTSAFPASLTKAQFVDMLNTNAGNPLSAPERDQLVNDLSTNAKTRAEVLRAVAEDPDLNSAEFNRAFVLMQYFGYLRRNPNDPQDSDYTGYDFWLTKLNLFNGNFVNAEMVKAFITSPEYRQRFGP